MDAINWILAFLGCLAFGVLIFVAWIEFWEFIYRD